MSNRKPISAKERLRLFALHGGVCHICCGRIDASREAWEVSHDIPLELGGADDDANRLLAHTKCHRKHTANVDVPNIAKAHRREKKNMGIRKRSSFQTSRSGQYKQKIGGEIVRRNAEGQSS